jgi:hypothetical protein
MSSASQSKRADEMLRAFRCKQDRIAINLRSFFLASIKQILAVFQTSGREFHDTRLLCASFSMSP